MEIIGKYNKATIMLDNIDETTYSQIQNMVNCPAIEKSKIVIMPDCHAGAGCVIGFTQTMNEYIIPNLIGVDIGCGVTSVNIGNCDLNLEKLDDFIRSNIPNGHNVNGKLSGDEYPEMLCRIEMISDKIGSNANRNQLALGSLGGGNHFIEVGINEYNNKWITVHSGSRKFGLDIANYHQKKAKDLLSQNGETVWKNLEYLTDGENKRGYLKDMKIAQLFAHFNRKTILYKIKKFLGFSKSFYDYVESTHNYIDFNDNIIRKGAISAYSGQKLVIPFNMEDGLIIGRGKSNPDWNFSAPHGAGRVFSRKQAKANLNLEDAQKSMKDKGIFTTSLSKNTLDEVKGAYKDKDLILNAIKDTIEIEHFVKPIYNFKAEE